MRPWPLEAALLFPYVPFLGPFPSCKRLLCTAPIRKEQEREEETANVNMIHLNAGPSRPRQVDHGGVKKRPKVRWLFVINKSEGKKERKKEGKS